MTTTATDTDLSVPPTASPTVEFISQIHLAPSTELSPVPTRGIDLAYLRRYVRALEDAGFDYTLVPYGSASADSLVVASAIGQLSETLKTVVAVRPNTVFPLVAAQQLATLDQLTEGRTIIHLISGGNDAEQARQGDYLTKDDRYARTTEFLQLLRRAWTERQPFSHHGRFYRFDDFGPGFATHSGRALPISIGGQSDAAFTLGGELADVFSFWGEPLAEIRAQLDRLGTIAGAAGRPDRPRIWVTFRPIIAATDELAWRKAYDYVERIGRTYRDGSYFMRGSLGGGQPQNVGSQRALEFADRHEVFDRALWTATAAATGASGAATALVGTPETVAAAILDYIDLGASLVSIRGYDNLNDTIDYGRLVLPLVRQELAHRAATGQRSRLQADHPGALRDGFDPAVLAAG
ncbi:LLM class flavin-dependent oxidoreductase [Raineyella sp. W15-4]|uniref:LLM class flavin-dependent oxidoreductase n=1 Tax=Raineyella sp. W15-4 TaxID=3081651 RepID=UPI002952EAC0|nr:LLM class flavin-dependent oxidoreductase [Raineyella sp. W15-4]WOQ16121.1 LLM class flavin-dependent oxidoreductase [Raineyella sp. W15-4]